MTSKKPTAKKTTAKKSRAKKPDSIKEKEVVASTEQEETQKNGVVKNDTTDNSDNVSRVEAVITKEDVSPKRHYVQIYKESYPIDALVGTIYWSDSANDILIEHLEGTHASQIENLMEGDLMLKDNTFVSRYESPKDWILNIPNAILGFNLYGKYFMETIDEAE